MTVQGNQTPDMRRFGGETRAQLALAALIVLLYLGLKLWLLTLVDDNVADREWGRYTYLAGGLDSVVAVAIGWLFGREVHRKAFDAASTNATHARELEKQARCAEGESRDAAVALRDAHITALQRADRGEGLAKAMKVIVSATHDDVASDQPAALDDTPPARHQVLEHVVAQAERAIAEFYPADWDSE
jgi:hypothetical protein